MGVIYGKSHLNFINFLFHMCTLLSSSICQDGEFALSKSPHEVPNEFIEKIFIVQIYHVTSLLPAGNLSVTGQQQRCVFRCFFRDDSRQYRK